MPTVSISTRGPSGPACTTKAPRSILAQVGISLQKMLQHEYGNAYMNPDWPDPKKHVEVQNPLLAQYHPANALRLLKEQLVAYLTKYHFRIWDWYDQSNPTISESPEPPEPPEPPGTIWFQPELTGTTGSVRTHSSELGSPLIDITTLFIPPCSIHSH